MKNCKNVTSSFCKHLCPIKDYCEEKIYCDCGQLATWAYMPGDRVACDYCVPRGCTCNQIETKLEFDDEVSECLPEGIEGKDWIWIEVNKLWEELDGEGKRLPCCEWWII